MQEDLGRNEDPKYAYVVVENLGHYCCVLFLTPTQVAATVLEKALYENVVSKERIQENMKHVKFFHSVQRQFRGLNLGNAENSQSRKFFNHCHKLSYLIDASHVACFPISTIASMSGAYERRSFSKLRLEERYPQHDAIIFDKASQMSDSKIVHAR